MKYLKIRWIAVLLVAVGTSFFFGFKSGDNRSFQVAKNLDIFNSIVKELDMFYVDTSLVGSEMCIRDRIR